ncbi:CBS domain-containing protein [Thermoproteota archaeon]
MINLSQLKEIRKKVGITQKDLAIHANVSQSLIAKIETGLIDPSYSNALKIEEAIAVLQQKKERHAKDIMTSTLLSVKKDTLCEEIIKLMLSNGISQLPVIEENSVIGLVTETSIIESKDKKYVTAEDVMTDAPPTVSENANITAVSNLLKFYPIIITKRKGELVGVVTKSDLLKEL